jgi:hypothetical protein
MRATKLRLVEPYEVVIPWYKTPGMVMTLRVLWWLLVGLFWTAVAVVSLLIVMMGLGLIIVGFLAHFVGGPPR